MKLVRIDHLPEDIDDLLKESQQEGFRFLTRLIDDFLSDRTAFDQPGEALFALRAGDGTLVGIGGVTRVTPALFRLRRVYIKAALRGSGAGRRLIEALESVLPDTALGLELRTDTRAAARFYERLDYRRCESMRRSHFKVLTRR